MRNKRLAPLSIVFIMILMLLGCSKNSPMQTVDYVDIDRFMGDWYVIANIPTPFEKGAHNAVESYAKGDNYTVHTTFKFLDDSFLGERKEYHPTGYILDKSNNALWGMQFIWPFKSDYRIVYLNDDYSQTIIGREKRDYVWIMARKPQLSSADYEHKLEAIKKLGYDVTQVKKVPQRWPNNPDSDTNLDPDPESAQ